MVPYSLHREQSDGWCSTELRREWQGSQLVREDARLDVVSGGLDAWRDV